MQSRLDSDVYLMFMEVVVFVRVGVVFIAVLLMFPKLLPVIMFSRQVAPGVYL